MSSSWGQLLPDQSTKIIVATSVITTIAVLGLKSIFLTAAPTKKTIASPRDTQLPRLTKDEQAALPYPPDVFPGARDVRSPYGTIKVYEWGSETGRKVLLIHGISTPCVLLGGVAQGLVEKGCRVMLIDLWGRGYSDMTDLPLDSRLYTTEILLAITSSPLPWTPDGFSMVGYSLGGGITVDFASYFPGMVKSVILLAPGGLIRSYHFSWSSRSLFKGYIPESVLEWLINRRMGGGGGAVKSLMEKTKTGDQDHPTTTAELKGNRDPQFESALLSFDTFGSPITIADVIQWQIGNHQGFVKSFISSVRNSSLENSHETWTKLSMRNDKVLIIAGTSDAVVVVKELREDAEATIGSRLDFRVIDGGHEFPVTDPRTVVGMISTFWGI